MYGMKVKSILKTLKNPIFGIFLFHIVSLYSLKKEKNTDIS